MFSLNVCSHPECRKQAVTRFDKNSQILQTAGFCLEHDPHAEETVNAIFTYIQNNNKIIGINMSGVRFENIDFTDKKFYGCNLQKCSFINVHSEFCRMRMSMLDFSIFGDCNMLNSNMQFTSFAGCSFSHVLWTNSDLVHNNFSGIIAQQSSFDDSDLYNSRFIRAKLINTSIRNCNIKKTFFYDAVFDNVSFKQSNTREAVFSKGKEPQ